MRQIEERTRLIPVVIDDCEIPMPLRAARRESIRKPDDFEPMVDRLVMAIHSMYDRPPLGTSPAYTRTDFITITGLPQVASLMLKLCYEILLEYYPNFPQSDEVITSAGALDIPRQEAIDGLEILDRRHYIAGHRVFGGDIFPSFMHTAYGLTSYLDAYMADYAQTAKSVIEELVNGGKTESDTIAKSLNTYHLVIIHVIEWLEGQQLLKCSAMNGGGVNVWDMSPELKYRL